jgi:Bifunctional DNA primase/polymerase, N-terminal
MSILETARAYAEAGWPVFPIHPIRDGKCGCGKACGQPGKHPASGGWQNTIASAKAVDGLWAERHGPRGIGLACGARAGVWALDVDPRHGGDVSIANLASGLGLPKTVTSHTGSGGYHLLFRWADGAEVYNSAGKVGPGLDVRGEGGYIVLPPSPHVSGRRYEWVHPPGAQDLAPAPDWLLELARKKPAGAKFESEGEDEALIPIGRRYEALISFVGWLRAAGLNEETIVECGHAFLRHQVEIDEDRHPLDLAHAEKNIRAGVRRWPPHPNREDR